MRRLAALGFAVVLCGAPCDARAQDVTRTGALVSVSVVPETVTVGQPFSVRIRVRAPKFATVHFPAVPDTADAIEAVDPRATEDAGDAEVIDRTAVYRLVAWDVGKRTPHFANVTVTTAGSDQVYPVEVSPVAVKSLLPADSAQRVPKEARDPVAPPSALWKWLLLGAVFAALIWLLWRRRKAARGTAAAGTGTVCRSPGIVRCARRPRAPRRRRARAACDREHRCAARVSRAAFSGYSRFAHGRRDRACVADF